MRLGFVGVGRWGQKLATAFRACGAEIVAHDRHSNASDGLGYVEVQNEKLGKMHMPVARLDGFGLRRSWREQLADPSIDAIIAVAPPEVTTEVALACAAAGKPVMATKPLFDHPETIRAPFYVDFWRLWSEAQREARDNPERQFTFVMRGSGPMRSFPGGLDYGAHAMAALLDLGSPRHMHARPGDGSGRTVHGGECFRVEGLVAMRHFHLAFGNGSLQPHRCIDDHEETATHIGSEPKAEILQRFCQSFMNDVSEGFVDTRLLELSRRGMAELRKIREMAK